MLKSFLNHQQNPPNTKPVAKVDENNIKEQNKKLLEFAQQLPDFVKQYFRCLLEMNI